MKIAMVGGGTGGHFYPHIAIAERIHQLVDERHLVEPELIYIGPDVFDYDALVEQNIQYVKTPAGRVRRYRSILNVLDFFRTGWGILRSIGRLFSIFPDVVFSTGGYAAFPTLVAARLLRIPVIIYDADARPGRVSVWSASFARWIGVAHPDAASHFPEKYREKIARIGHPIRIEIEHVTDAGGHEFLKLDPSRRTILVLGGSQGAQAINNAIIDALPQLLQRYNVIHQTGKANLDEVLGMAKLSLDTVMSGNHYRAFGILNAMALKMAAGISDLIVTRAGSGTIFEIASWGKPSITIPIPQTISHDQTENAFSFARAGASVVIEQENIRTSVLVAAIDNIMENPGEMAKMGAAAKQFAQPEAAKKIARILIDTALEHEE